MKAIIPAAGLGTRFLPTTKSVPKEMLPVLDKPVLQYVVEEALDAPACDGCVVILSESKRSIEAYFCEDAEYRALLTKPESVAACETAEKLGPSITYVYQNKARGLGDAVHHGAEVTGDEPFYVLLGDVVVPEHAILNKLYEVSQAHGGANVIAVFAVPDEQISRFGIISGECIAAPGCDTPDLHCDVPGSVWKIDSMVEKPKLKDAPSRLAIFGRYLLSPRIMELLATQEPGAGNEIQLTDTLVRSLATEPMYAYVIDPSDGYDTGTIPNYIAANVLMGLNDERYASALREALANILA